MNAAVAGDLVYVFNGSYTGFQFVSPHVSGTSGSPITVQAQSSSVIINAAGDVAGDGINVEAVNYIVIDGFTVPSMSRMGIRLVLTTGSVAKNNVITGAGNQGILTGFAPLVQLLSNTISGTTGQHGIYVSNSDTGYDAPVVRGNISHDNAGNGMQINGDCQTLDPSGFSDGMITAALVENNVMYNNAGSGFSIINASDSTFRNNLLYNNTGGAGEIKLADQGCNLGSNRNLIVNNTVSNGVGTAGIRIVQGTGNIMFNNLIVSNTYKCVIDATGANCDNAGSGSGNYFQTGLDRLFSQIAGIFTSYTTGDYTLVSGSPAIDVGIATFQSRLAPVVDLLNNVRPVNSLYDAGAYEFGSTAATPDTIAPTSPGTPSVTATAYQVALAWTASTDNREVIGYIVYRDSLAFTGVGTPAFTDTSTVPGSTHAYVIYAYDDSGNISTASGTANVTVPGQLGCMNADTSWRSVLIPAQSGTFQFTADITPYGSAPTNAVIGLSFAVPAGFSDLATIVRFPASGIIDARNGSAYTADNTIPYTAGTAYHFRMPINVVTHTYSVYVTPAGSGETLLASNYAFRTEQSGAVRLGYLGTLDDQPGSVAVCAPAVDGVLITSLSYISISSEALFTQLTSTSIVDANGNGKPLLDRPKAPALTASRSLTLGDNGGLLSYSGSTPITVTVPTGLGIGFGCTIVEDGAGVITFVGSGLSLISRTSATHTIALGSAAVVQCSGADVCHLWGDVQ